MTPLSAVFILSAIITGVTSQNEPCFNGSEPETVHCPTCHTKVDLCIFMEIYWDVDAPDALDLLNSILNLITVENDIARVAIMAHHGADVYDVLVDLQPDAQRENLNLTQIPYYSVGPPTVKDIYGNQLVQFLSSTSSSCVKSIHNRPDVSTVAILISNYKQDLSRASQATLDQFEAEIADIDMLLHVVMALTYGSANTEKPLAKPDGAYLYFDQHNFSSAGVDVVNKACPIDECDANPCLNGTCTKVYPVGYHCACWPGYTGINCSIDINDCLGASCLHGATCVDGLQEYSCICPEGYTGSSCETDIDDCGNPSVCEHGSVCIDQLNAYLCICTSGYTDNECATEIDECDSNPCNHGECVDSINRFTCNCDTGFTGITCAENINDCEVEPAPCTNGVCVDQIDGVMCVCSPGYSGQYCDQEIDECVGAVCLNGGTCIDAINGYSCRCSTGFSGSICQINIDDCAEVTCPYNKQCVDLTNDYICVCPPGEDCEAPATCSDVDCLNGGICSPRDEGPVCICETGFTGVICSTNIDDCIITATEEYVCQNGGTCYDLVRGYICLCPPEYTGDDCSQRIDPCESVVCLNEGTCNSNTDPPFCRCARGYNGTHCEHRIGVCSNSTCKNGGTCVNREDTYSCFCGPGYHGTNCEQVTDPCEEVNCFNGGHCEAAGTDYQCICTAGYSGRLCEKDIDDCDEADCDEDQGVCVDGVNSYTCLCRPGFQGNSCSQTIDHCIGAPCRYEGTCVNGINGFTCECTEGSTGKNCEINIDDCTSDSCFNGGTCVDNLNGYTCVCPPGYTGPDCSQGVDDCKRAVCLHGSTCVDAHLSYSCTCSPGYTGIYCEADIDECSSTPCANGGTCIDMVQGFQCTCEGGFTGTNCEVDVNFCDPSPCHNNGICVPSADSYKCECSEGYIGKNCQIASHCELGKKQCKNGGTCSEHAEDNSVRCTCVPPYVGLQCGRIIIGVIITFTLDGTYDSDMEDEIETNLKREIREILPGVLRSNMSVSVRAGSIKVGAMTTMSDGDVAPSVVALETAMYDPDFTITGYQVVNGTVAILTPGRCLEGQEFYQGVCVDCTIGFYKENAENVTCTACNVGYTTETQGSTSPMDCYKVCPAGKFKPTKSDETCEDCRLNTYSTGIQGALYDCTLCGTNRFTTTTGADSKSDCIDICQARPDYCQNGGTCIFLLVTAEAMCRCRLGFGGRTCSNKVSDLAFITPSLGHIAGGAVLTIHGVNLNSSYNPQVTLGNNTGCHVLSSNDTTILCMTQPVDGTFIGVPLPVSIHWSTNGFNSYFPFITFEYQPNPVAMSIIPPYAPISGGTMVVVEGEEFLMDAILKLEVEVTTNFAGDYHFTGPCTTASATDVTCRYPNMSSLPESIQEVLDTNNKGTIVRRRRQSREVVVSICLSLGGSCSSIMQQTYTGHIFIDPKFEMFDKSQVFRGYWPYNHDYIDLLGERLDTALSQDVAVLIGNGHCTDVTLYENRIRCSPPGNRPSKKNTETDSDLREICIEFGNNIAHCAGYIKIEDHFLENAIGQAVVGGSIALLLVIVGVTAFCIVRRRRRKRRARYERQWRHYASDSLSRVSSHTPIMRINSRAGHNDFFNPRREFLD